jgi:hypothetical protein
MTIKLENAALLRRIQDVLVDQKHFADGVCLTGLNVKWRPSEVSVNGAFLDAISLINQAIGIFDKQEDFPPDQWGAMQQLYMARALLGGVYESIYNMKFVEQ